jgi:hypothetical protein
VFSLQRPKEHKVYDDWEDAIDSEIEGRRTFNLHAKLESDLYDSEFVTEVQGTGMINDHQGIFRNK